MNKPISAGELAKWKDDIESGMDKAELFDLLYEEIWPRMHDSYEHVVGLLRELSSVHPIVDEAVDAADDFLSAYDAPKEPQ